MGRDDEDDFEYTATDLNPREPDRFEKRGNAIEHADNKPDGDKRRETREGR